jgi:hypothetical protein
MSGNLQAEGPNNVTTWVLWKKSSMGLLFQKLNVHTKMKSPCGVAIQK